MKKIIQICCIACVILGISYPLSANKNSLNKNKLTVKKRATVDFVAYNSTSSTAWVYLYNTVTNEGTYYSVPANTPSTGTVIGQITENSDIYTGTVQINDASLRNIQLYWARETGVNTLNASDMAIGCGACAFVSID